MMGLEASVAAAVSPDAGEEEEGGDRMASPGIWCWAAAAEKEGTVVDGGRGCGKSVLNR